LSERKQIVIFARSDGSKQVAAMMQKHDWYYEMSDDHNVWRRGESSRRKLMEALKKLPYNTRRFLWDTYAPDGFDFPKELHDA